MSFKRTGIVLALLAASISTSAFADENLFGYVRGSETLPKRANKLYQFATVRSDKGQGNYQAIDLKTEYERGITDRFQMSGALKAMAIDTKGLTINGYLPGDKEFGPRLTGVEAEMIYNFLSPAKDDIGLSAIFGIDHQWIDPHSGRKKNTTSVEIETQLQRYFLDGQLIWVGNGGLEATYAKRKAIRDLPADFEWSTDPEMELELKFGTGLSYRFAPNWYAGAEVLYDTEFETGVGQERWSIFGGPSLHYGGKKWWMTLTWLTQLRGGGEKYDGQSNTNLHLIEKTKKKNQVKVGMNF